ALPELAKLCKLETLLSDWPADRTFYFADESGGEAMTAAVGTGPAALLIGPEGGFTSEEREVNGTVAKARAISLGPRILRADTAAIAAMAVWMSLAGDWSTPPTR